jgi:streptogramin lyase
MRLTARKPVITTYSRRPAALARHAAIKSAAALLFASVTLLLVAASAMAAFSVFPVNVLPDCGGVCSRSGLLAVPGVGTSPIAAGPDGNMWFGGQIRLENEPKPAGNRDINAVVAKVTPSGAVTEYNIASGFYRGHAEINAITRGPDGNLWFTGSVSLPNESYTTPLEGNCCYHLPDGSVTAPGEGFGRAVIGKITTTGVITEYITGTLANAGLGPVSGIEAVGIATGPDGNLWFAGGNWTLHGGSTGVVGKITTAGVVTEYTAGISAVAKAIAAGPDGNLWFTEASNKIGKITTAGAVTEYGGISNSETVAITKGPGHSMWFSEAGGEIGRFEELHGRRAHNRVGKITMTGSVTEYAVKRLPGNIAVGSDGNVWFTEPYCERIARITTRGVVTGPYGYGSGSANCPLGNLPQRSFATGMARGADGNLWLTLRAVRGGSYSGYIARFSTKSEKKPGTQRRPSHKRGKKRH